MTDSQTATLTHQTNSTFVPPAYDTPHVVRQFEEVLNQVAETIAPVWPLKDYVAVNPYAGISERPFMDARAFLQVFSDCELLMPIEHYADQFQKGRISVADLEAAIADLEESGIYQSLSARQIAKNLQSIHPLGNLLDQPAADQNPNRRVRTIAEYARSHGDVDWSEEIRDEVSKHCSAHYDEGQATWASPYQHLSLYHAWRNVATHDRNIEVLGLTGFRQYVADLPHTPEAAIIHSLQQLDVPQSLWSTFLLCQAFSLPGWSAWAKYQSSWKESSASHQEDFAGLLAIRLAYDAALAQAKAININWSSLTANGSSSFQSSSTNWGDDSVLRYLCLRASEIGFCNNLLGSLSVVDEQPREASGTRKLVQMVFCIDVRSERIRRHLESVSGEIETFGFAGFFGMPIEYVPLGESRGNSHVPVLLKPQFKLFEGLQDSRAPQELEAVEQRQQIRSWRGIWKKFQSSAVGCFAVVETTGLFYALKLAAGAFGYASKPVDFAFDGLSAEDHDRLGPTLRSLNQQGITPSHQADLAESMLRNLGLTKDFARLVVVCGHSSQTENNPLAAVLDCGACGGHSGEPNARLAAMLLNQPYIRSALADRGLLIPEDTHFLAGLHNTTTDWIEYFDLADVPTTHTSDVRELMSCSTLAGKQTRQERMPIVGGRTLSDLVSRASDWSEVRPEWGLAGNAAFIAAPRSVTKHTDHGGRSFLHSYDHKLDPDGSVLETIMTAPMVVAHWINMQYYASTVDNHHFGSGNKTVHNVVGQFGILSGNGGDLMTGLPWQSIHNGDEYQHFPMRLLTVIAAPRDSIERVIEKHEAVANLLSGGWLHLIAIDDEEQYRYTQDGSWELIGAAQLSSPSVA